MKALLRTLPWVVLSVKVAVALVNVVAFPRLVPGGAGSEKSRRVSVLVPARDEAPNLRLNLGGVLGQEALEVLVLDDDSRDETSEVAAGLGACVLRGQPLPPGWNGKTWACHQLSRAAQGDFLLFTDADVTWSPGALNALLAEQERTGADLLSVFPRQANVTPGERLLTPLVDHVLLTLLPAPLLRVRHRLASAANGQVMLFRREAYTRLGGHAAVQNHLLEDVALSQHVKAAGGRVSVALGRDLISVRMYRSYPESVRGFGKNALTVHGGSRLALSASWMLNLLTYTVPLLRGHPGPILLAGLEGVLVRRLTGRTRPADLAEILLAPLLPLAALPVYVRALRRNVEWKGRHYAQDRQ
ncbi:glycosyltransferase family 2 protein [Deinococcus deserti]|uniref:Putative glycosyl transferase, family 2 n=1 Tax=Deinococcus deserti (strain DSM 17065 / CIP 109153 / LMG 22923 / VCD115) TaxID=546414 RepID=C1D2Z6_DEIDV|nr:glycosyltransferase family 2 protein [Deinococcus deserti]ACO47785.1 putative glycosyl transferase, family 2 [Deinococcus deserti VCD115]